GVADSRRHECRDGESRDDPPPVEDRSIGHVVSTISGATYARFRSLAHAKRRRLRAAAPLATALAERDVDERQPAADDVAQLAAERQAQRLERPVRIRDSLLRAELLDPQRGVAFHGEGGLDRMRPTVRGPREPAATPRP